MQTITSQVGLKEAIKELENKQSVEGQLLKEQFNITYATVKPVNLIKTLSEVVSSPDIIASLVSATVGLTAGFFSKRLFIGASGNLVKKVFGSMLLFGVTKIIARRPEVVKLFGKRIVQHVFSKKEAKLKK